VLIVINANLNGDLRRLLRPHQGIRRIRTLERKILGVLRNHIEVRPTGSAAPSPRLGLIIPFPYT
jgi:hypothetical protein